ncbi:MAG: DUF4166 domain-containing protein [Proteobacteria bacterium]|nr:DUF4166 domain-containing protein [Pseudomonadota bacterium]
MPRRPKPLKILIVGGYGTFGGRLARLLAHDARAHLIISGRSLAKGEAFCRTLPEGAERSALVFDRQGDVEAGLKAIAPHVVVDATGPFQAYGDDPYRLVRAAIATGVDYLDLADGSAFVEGVSAFDAEAKARGVTVLSGVSTVPVLTAAAVRRLAAGMERVDAMAAGIAPSPRAGVGLNVIRAITAYAGKPVRVLRDGQWVEATGIVDGGRFTIAPPGVFPLNHLRFTLVDTPDLTIMPRLWPSLRTVWIGAGPTPELLQTLLIGLSRLVRIGLIPTLEPLSPLFHRVLNVLRWGANRGGMFVTVRGVAGGEPVERSWHLIAEGSDGPMIPSMPAVALLKRRLDGERFEPGARASTREVELEDYQPLFDAHAISTGIREASRTTAAQPLYRRLLDEAWDRLPEPVRDLHDLNGSAVFEGRCEVERGSGPLAALAALIMGLPKAGRDVPVRVEFGIDGDGAEVWRRSFDGKALVSVQAEGSGLSQWLIDERFGPITLGLGIVVSPDSGRLSVLLRRWSLFGLPIPRFLGPRGGGSEFVDDEGRFRFDVDLGFALIGRIVRYSGWLKRAA